MPPPGDVCCLSDELFMVFTFLPACDLMAASHTCREWQGFADDPALWGKLCACLWSGKAYVPRAYIQEGGDAAMPRKQAYFLSARDAFRSDLRVEELCSFTWERIRNDADIDLHNHTNVADPSLILGDVCAFRAETGQRRGVMEALPGVDGFGIVGGDMIWKMSQRPDHRTGQLVTFVSNGPIHQYMPTEEPDSDEDDGHYYPPKPVWRTPGARARTAAEGTGVRPQQRARTGYSLAADWVARSLGVADAERVHNVSPRSYALARLRSAALCIGAWVGLLRGGGWCAAGTLWWEPPLNSERRSQH